MLSLKKLILSLAISLMLGSSLLAQNIELTGSGATFPEPLYRKMFDEYNKQTGVKVNYQGIGSGGGIKQLTDKVTDFGATDAFMSEAELKAAGQEIIHIPTCLGAVVVIYNVPGINKPIKLSANLISDIFLGKITSWDDAKIAAENKDLKLPKLKIAVVRRADSSGTTYIFTEFLSKTVPEWREKVGTDKAPNWPTGVGAKGNPGVAELVSRTPGAIGYVELVYAMQNKITFADIKNKSGKYITPNLNSVSLAAQVQIADDTRVSLTDTAAPDGYPIASFTWLIVYKEQNYNNRSLAKAQALVNLLWWLVHSGQQYNEGLNYGKLPPSGS